MVRTIISVSSWSTRSFTPASSVGSSRTVLVTMVSARSPQLMASPVPSVRCMQGLPAAQLTVIGDVVVDERTRLEMFDGRRGAAALSKLPPTAVAASMQISGRWRLPALAVNAESGAYR